MQKFINIITEWIFNAMKITFVWWISNFLYIFIVLSLLVNRDVPVFNTLFLTGIVIVPFVLVPANSAALAIAREFFIKGSDYKLFKEYIKYYKSEYKRSMVIGIIYIILLAVLISSFLYYYSLIGKQAFIFLILSGMVNFIFLYVLSFLVDRKLTIKECISNGIILYIRHIALSLFMTCEIIVFIYFSFKFVPAFLILICPGVVALITMYFYRESMKLELRINRDYKE